MPSVRPRARSGRTSRLRASVRSAAERLGSELSSNGARTICGRPVETAAPASEPSTPTRIDASSIGVLADGDLDLELVAAGVQQLDRDGRRAGQRQRLLGEHAQGALGVQLFGQGGAGGLQAGDFGEPVADFAVQARVLDGDGQVVRQQLHHLAILGVEDARRVVGQHADDAHQLALPPDRHGHAGLDVGRLGQRVRDLVAGSARRSRAARVASTWPVMPSPGPSTVPTT